MAMTQPRLSPSPVVAMRRDRVTITGSVGAGMQAFQQSRFSLTFNSLYQNLFWQSSNKVCLSMFQKLK